jgi:hypothetical protein
MVELTQVAAAVLALLTVTVFALMIWAGNYSH